VDWWNQDQGGNWWDRQPADTTTAPPQGFFGGIVHGVESAGSFFGGIAKAGANVAKSIIGIVPQAVKDFETTVGTFKDMATAVVGQHQANQIIDEANQKRHQLQADYDAKRISLDDFNQGIQQLQGQLQKNQQNLQAEGINKRDAAKSAAASANTVLNIGTLGFGGLAEQGVKTAAKLGIGGAEDLGARLAEEKAVQAAAGAAANRTAAGAASTVGKNLLEGGALGAGYGALAPIEQQGSQATPEEIWRSALTGGALGGVLSGGSTLLDRNVREGLGKAPGALREANAKAGEGGYVAPFAPPGGEAHPPADQVLNTAQEIASEYKSPADYITQTAKNALESEKGNRGGVINPATGTRSTEHAPWYSDYFASTGRAPTLQATKDIVEQGLRSGRGVNGLVAPEESAAYHILQDREQGLQQTIKEGPPADLAGQYTSDLQGKPAQRQLKLGNAKGKFPDTSLPTPAAPEAFPPNQRGFFRNVRTAETTAPELKQAVADVNPQTYSDITTNRELVQKAVSDVAENPNAIRDKVLSGNELSDQDVVSGLHLMGQYQRAGQTADAVRLADALDTNLRAHGRAVQAASVLNRLTPEGVLRFAANRFEKAREDVSAGRGFGKGAGSEQKVAKEIQGTIENAGTVTTKNVQKAVRGAAKAAEGKSSTGEKIAKNVEKMASPTVKKKADILVKEITKKVKQEMLDSPKKPVRSPLDVMREVFARNQEAQDAFPEAQRILMDKAKNNPEMQAVLQKFFDSELGHPAAGSTINAAIKEQLVKSETKISDIITKSWNGQRQSIDEVALDLTKEGFDPEAAKTIAKEVTDRLKAQTVVAKQAALQRLSREAPKRTKAMYVDKVSKLSNLGALDNHDYLELARARLKLPQLTTETAAKISSLAQKMQDLAPGAERDAVRREIYKTINESIPKTFGQKVDEVLSAPKALQASTDISGVLHQGGVLGARFPKEFKTAFGRQVTYFKSAEAFNQRMSAIRLDPLYETASRARLALTGVEGAEEAFASQLPERIPIAGKLVKASDRAYTGALTDLRFMSFKHIAQDLKDAGIDITSFSDEQLQSLGKFINTASGRGSGPKGGLFEKVAPALNRTLFSPRLWKSRLDMLNPVYYAKLDPIARKYALQSAGSFAGIAATVLGLASAMGAKVETDPRSSDYLKIRVGDTRYDILGGFQQDLVFAWREISGEKKSSTTGDITDLTSGQFGSANRLSILSDLVQNKENPVLSTGADILRGTDAQGKPINVPTALGSLALPLSIQDTYSVAKASNPLQALLTGAIPSAIGVGVNTYAAPDDSPYQKYLASLSGG
jgi:hypothetical protein